MDSTVISCDLCPMKDYLKVNRQMWNLWAEAHLTSDFYDVESFKAGRNSLNDIELAHLPDVKGKDLLHLQCHFGQDTLSLARMGAKVTGMDISDVAIEAGRKLAKEMKLEADFIEGNVLKMNKYLDRQFDIIFNTYGVVGWHPELERWMQLIAEYLKPGGEFHLTEFHPFIWMYSPDFQQIDYSYFNTGPMLDIAEGSYAVNKIEGEQSSFGWNHSISSLLSAIRKSGLKLEVFEEYDYTPYNVFQGSVKTEKGYQIGPLKGKVPLTYSIVARKPLD